MQLPVVNFEICTGGKGSQKLYMTEQHSDVDYVKFVSLFRQLIPKESYAHPGLINKDTLNALCGLASTESDRKLIRYAACHSRGLTQRKSSKEYGVSNFKVVQSAVEESL